MCCDNMTMYSLSHLSNKIYRNFYYHCHYITAGHRHPQNGDFLIHMISDLPSFVVSQNL